MKLLILATFIAACTAAYVPQDSSIILPINEFPGFWDNRDFPRAFYSGNDRSSRIVGGTEVPANAHPQVVALHVQRTAGVALCGGSVLSLRAVLTAGRVCGLLKKIKVDFEVNQFQLIRMDLILILRFIFKELIFLDLKY